MLGVNQRVSSVSTNLVLTARKAISLCFSVWWFGNGWNAQLGIGAGMVFLGSLLYTAATSRGSKPSPLPTSSKKQNQTHRRMRSGTVAAANGNENGNRAVMAKKARKTKAD